MAIPKQRLAALRAAAGVPAAGPLPAMRGPLASSIACVLVVSVYALGGVSGTNFNPAVSFALGRSNKLAWKEVGIYCAVQIAAGICAGLCWAGLLWKVLYTFVLCFVVVNCAASKKNGCGSMKGNQLFYGLATGFVIVAGGYGAGGVLRRRLQPRSGHRPRRLQRRQGPGVVRSVHGL